MVMRDVSHVSRRYGAMRALRFVVADRRGRGLYTPEFSRTRSLFIHVPKVAGSSIFEALYGQEGRHHPSYLYRYVNGRKYDAYFKFGFVRNPWDRLVSAYHYLSQGGKRGVGTKDHNWFLANIAQYRDFEQFVHEWVNEANIRTGVHFIPQSYFLCDPESGEVMVDFVGRYETLARDFEHVRSRLGSQAELAVRNPSSRGSYRDYYTPDMIEIVAKAYATDTGTFNYGFE